MQNGAGSSGRERHCRRHVMQSSKRRSTGRQSNRGFDSKRSTSKQSKRGLLLQSLRGRNVRSGTR